MSEAPPGRSTSRVVRGDWQTPDALALRLTRRLASLIGEPRTVIEPTCGRGAFLRAAGMVWPHSRRLGVELDASHCDAARARLDEGVEVHQGDVFTWDWSATVACAAGPVLFLGNPPWVTADALGRRDAHNRPPRQRSSADTALAALTGAGNFDISEWVLAECASRANVAMLCKARVARALIRQRPDLGGWVWEVDARRHFAAAVSCVFIATGGPKGQWLWHPLDERSPARRVAVLGGRVVDDGALWERTEALTGEGLAWRSGVKHDCARVMELEPEGNRWRSRVEAGLGLEPQAVFPLLKGGDLDRGIGSPRRGLLVTQGHTGEDPEVRLRQCPQAWGYLQRHADRLNGRRSRIYAQRPFAAMFGIGPYSFAPWKVAVSALSKHRRFRLVGPVAGRPVLFDDTCLFVPFEDEATARRAHTFLCGPEAQGWLEARTSPDAKRTLTARLLKTLKVPGVDDEATAASP